MHRALVEHRRLGWPVLCLTALALLPVPLKARPACNEDYRAREVWALELVQVTTEAGDEAPAEEVSRWATTATLEPQGGYREYEDADWLLTPDGAGLNVAFAGEGYLQ